MSVSLVAYSTQDPSDDRCTHLHVSNIPVGKGAAIALLCFFNGIRPFTDRCPMLQWSCLTAYACRNILKRVEDMFCVLSCVCVSLLIWSALCFIPFLTDPLSSCEDSQSAFSGSVSTDIGVFVSTYSSTANTPLVSSCMSMSKRILGTFTKGLEGTKYFRPDTPSMFSAFTNGI